MLKEHNRRYYEKVVFESNLEFLQYSTYIFQNKKRSLPLSLSPLLSFLSRTMLSIMLRQRESVSYSERLVLIPRSGHILPRCAIQEILLKHTYGFLFIDLTSSITLLAFT